MHSDPDTDGAGPSLSDPAGTPETSTDVAVVGGGPAGLQAALTLGRIHRDTVLFDDRTYRNATVSHMHNVVGFDGTPPHEFRARAREQLTAYDSVSVRDVGVEEITPADGRFRLDLADGTVVVARGVVLATGVRDELPDVPGLRELWGDLAAHCPFCHGHEFTGRRIGILGAASGAHLSRLLGPIASDLLVVTRGEEVPDTMPDGPALRTEPVTRVERHEGGVRITFADGPDEDVAALFTATTLRQSAPFAERLGLTLNPSGGILVDEFARTSLAGVWAAGDLAHLAAHPMPLQSVVHAAAAGQLAASSAQAALMATDPQPQHAHR